VVVSCPPCYPHLVPRSTPRRPRKRPPRLPITDRSTRVPVWLDIPGLSGILGERPKEPPPLAAGSPPGSPGACPPRHCRVRCGPLCLRPGLKDLTFPLQVGLAPLAAGAILALHQERQLLLWAAGAAAEREGATVPGRCSRRRGASEERRVPACEARASRRVRPDAAAAAESPSRRMPPSRQSGFRCRPRSVVAHN